MEESTLHSLNIYVFDLGIDSKISTRGAIETAKVTCK